MGRMGGMSVGPGAIGLADTIEAASVVIGVTRLAGLAGDMSVATGHSSATGYGVTYGVTITGQEVITESVGITGHMLLVVEAAGTITAVPAC